MLIKLDYIRQKSCYFCTLIFNLTFLEETRFYSKAIWRVSKSHHGFVELFIFWKLWIKIHWDKYFGQENFLGWANCKFYIFFHYCFVDIKGNMQSFQNTTFGCLDCDFLAHFLKNCKRELLVAFKLHIFKKLGITEIFSNRFNVCDQYFMSYSEI